MKKEEIPHAAHNAPGYYTKIPPITSTAALDTVVPYEEEPQVATPLILSDAAGAQK